MENKGVSIYSIDAECNKMTIHLDEIKKVCDAKKLLEDRIDKAIEYLGHCDCDQVCENITLYSKILLEILKGDKEW